MRQARARPRSRPGQLRIRVPRARYREGCRGSVDPFRPAREVSRVRRVSLPARDTARRRSLGARRPVQRLRVPPSARRRGRAVRPVDADDDLSHCGLLGWIVRSHFLLHASPSVGRVDQYGTGGVADDFGGDAAHCDAAQSAAAVRCEGDQRSGKALRECRNRSTGPAVEDCGSGWRIWCVQLRRQHVESRTCGFDLSISTRFAHGLDVLVGPDHFGQPRLQLESSAPRGRRRDDAVGHGRAIRAHLQPASFGRQQRGPASWADEYERSCRSADDLGGDAAQHSGPDAALAPGGHAQRRVGLCRGDREDRLGRVALVADPSFDVDDVAGTATHDRRAGAVLRRHRQGHNSPASTRACSTRAAIEHAGRMARSATTDPSSGTTIVVMILRTSLPTRWPGRSRPPGRLVRRATCTETRHSEAATTAAPLDHPPTNAEYMSRKTYD